MHKKLSFQLFGSPQIYLDDEPVFFSFSKVNALLYYLVVHSSVSRNEAAGILWPNKSEKSAKKICEIQFTKQIKNWMPKLLFHPIKLFYN
nr:hypothetical protein [Enterococcus innesii]